MTLLPAGAQEALAAPVCVPLGVLESPQETGPPCWGDGEEGEEALWGLDVQGHGPLGVTRQPQEPCLLRHQTGA